MGWLKRSLPKDEMGSDRWKRAESLGFGKGTNIYLNSYVYGDVTVGENTWIGPFTILDGSGGLQIGSHCAIGAGVQIYTHDTMNWTITGGKEPYEYSPVTIGNNCFIAPSCFISRGVTIGDGAIIGANSFVNKNVKPGSKVAGSPAREI